MKQTLLGFIKKELLQTLRDPRMRILLFVMPMIQLSLFGVAISDRSQKCQVGCCNFDSKRHRLARYLRKKAIASEWFIPAISRRNIKTPIKLIEIRRRRRGSWWRPPEDSPEPLGRGDAPVTVA